MEAELLNLLTEVDDCLGASNLCRPKIRSAIGGRLKPLLSTLYVACRENIMSLCGKNDRNVNEVMAAVYGQLLCFRRCHDEVHGRTQKHGLNAAEPYGSSSSTS